MAINRRNIDIQCNSAYVRPYPHEGGSFRAEITVTDIEAVIAGMDSKDLIEYVKANFSPESIFDNDRLKAWAEINGYVKAIKNKS
jgi:hypothetical protein